MKVDEIEVGRDYFLFPSASHFGDKKRIFRFQEKWGKGHRAQLRGYYHGVPGAHDIRVTRIHGPAPQQPDKEEG